MNLTTLDKKIIQLLQEDIPLTLTPYQDMAEQLNISETDLIKRIQQYLDEGLMRRMGGVVRHQKMGYKSNSMVVWHVPEHQIEATGKHMAAHNAVSHCYLRPAVPNFPYNLYTMIHGQKPGDCQLIVEQLSRETGIADYKMLKSIRELKKTSMKYFEDK